MKNACAFMYITVGANVSSIVLSAGSYGVTGTATATISTEGNEIAGTVTNQGDVTLTDVPSAGGTFMMCILPSSSYSSLDLTINYTDGTQTTRTFGKTGSNMQLVAGRLYDLGDYSK